MKIGAGGLQSMIVNEQVTARRPEHVRAAPIVEEEALKQQSSQEKRIGPELNKPVFNPESPAYMNNHLKGKELKAEERTKKKDSKAKRDPGKKHGVKKVNHEKEEVKEGNSGFLVDKLV